MAGWAVVAVPILAVFLVSVVQRLLLWLASLASVLGLLRAVMRD